MPQGLQADLKHFRFRNLHPQVRLGTASDRYAGWLGQIYSEERYLGRLSQRTKAVGGQSFTETVLPVESVAEYFEHFPVLEIDFTFYRLLIDQQGRPTQNFQTLKAYSRHLRPGDALLLKAPQAVMAPRLRRGRGYVANPDYLDVEVFTRRFYEPALELLGPALAGFIFEQEYLPKKDRPPVAEMTAALDDFFRAIPRDHRYHLELRTDLYLREPVFEALAMHGVGQVLSHWTWLPPLRKQLAKAGGRFFNAGRQSVIRLLTPLGVRYEDTYVQAFPFAKLVDGLWQPEMVLETADLMGQAVHQGITVNVIINNRAGGNAPLLAQMIAGKFLERGAPVPKPEGPKGQLRLW